MAKAIEKLSNDITITMDGEEYELRASLKAATNISTRFGGFNGALQALANNDLGAFQYVVRQAVPVKTISSDDLNEAVWRAGTRNLLTDVMKYVGRLSNGGRDPEETDESDEDAAGNVEL